MTKKKNLERCVRNSKGQFAKGNMTGNKFEPGQSGNPAGAPKRKSNLFVWLCKYLEMTDAKIKKLNRAKLTQSQQYALNLVENMKGGKGAESERFARHLFDRDEGKPTEHIFFGNEDALSDSECDEIREMLKANVD